MRGGLLLIVGACLAGCPGPTDPATPDGNPGGDGNQDGQVGDSKLRIEWATNPLVPGGLTALGHRLDDVRFRMENLKATVDVDPNDPNTTLAEVKLHWDDDNEPEAITFSDAPAGRYTSIVLKLDEGDGEEAFEIRGQTSSNESFRFDDRASLPISMACNVVLAPGETKTLVVDIDLSAAVGVVDIDALGAGFGVDHHLEADDEPVVMAQFRTALQAAFSVRTSQQ